MFLLFLVDVTKLSGLLHCLCYRFVIAMLIVFCRIIEKLSGILYTLRFGQSLERVLKFKNLLLFITLFYFLIDVAKISGLFFCLCYCFVIAMLMLPWYVVDISSLRIYNV